MCKWGNTKLLEVTIPAKLSSTGKDKKKIVDIDECILEIVKALNDSGIVTIASCCGHNKRPGSIILGDGREFIICKDYETARIAEKAFPPIFEEEK